TRGNVPDISNSPTALLSPKVMVIEFRPDAVPAQWAKTENLVRDYISTMRMISSDALIYVVTEMVTVKKFPLLMDGRQYDNASWNAAWKNDRLAYRDDNQNYLFADYQQIIKDFDIINKIEDQFIDEVWMFGAPYFGFYESRMVGSRAYWCNAPAIEMNCRKFVMMGFNYERSVKEMVHDFGHRAESILSNHFGSQPFMQMLYSAKINVSLNTNHPKNEFELFLQTHGTVHRVPGGVEYGQDEISWLKALKPAWLPVVADPNLVE
ncbi:MAG: hypothetical protein WCP19_08440, partial [Chloroflexota bacterium]